LADLAIETGLNHRHEGCVSEGGNSGSNQIIFGGTGEQDFGRAHGLVGIDTLAGEQVEQNAGDQPIGAVVP